MAEGNIVVVPAETDTAEEAELRSALEKSDRQTDYENAPNRMPEPDVEETKAQEPESPTDAVDKKSDSSEPDAEPQRDEKGRFLPKAKVEAEVKPLTEGEPEVEQPKPDREAERQARAWQKIQNEKTEVRNALAEVRQLKEQLARSQQQPSQSQQRFGSRQYAAGAEEFERKAQQFLNEGDVDQAKQQLNLAQQSRQLAQQSWQQEQQEAQQQQAQGFQRDWQSTAELEISKHPELGDPSRPEAQAMMELLEDYPILGYIPDGFAKGVEILRMRQEAASASELRTEVEQLRKENQELRSKTSISGGGLTAKVGGKDFDSMSLDEQDAYLERQARSQDYAQTS